MCVRDGQYSGNVTLFFVLDLMYSCAFVTNLAMYVCVCVCVSVSEQVNQ